jgi:NADH dehydrogenase FAD-containing subunit
MPNWQDRSGGDPAGSAAAELADSCQRGSDYPGHPAIFAPGDLMSAHGLPGAAEVAVKPGLQAAHRIPVRSKEVSAPPVSA